MWHVCRVHIFVGVLVRRSLSGALPYVKAFCICVYACMCMYVCMYVHMYLSMCMYVCIRTMSSHEIDLACSSPCITSVDVH